MKFNTNFVRHDPVQKILQAASDAVCERISERGFEFCAPAESPIEEVLGTAICTHYRHIARDHRFKVWPQEMFDQFCGELEAEETDPYEEYDVLAANQYQMDGARTDFIFAHKNWRRGNVFRLVVECDGHDFHERTKEQAARDRARDRMLQDKGWGVFRFTGSEIWKDPMGCAFQIADWLDRKSCET